MTVRELAERAKEAAGALRLSSAQERTSALTAMSASLTASRTEILAANAADLKNAADNGMAPVMLDRLRLDEKRLAALAESVRAVAALPEIIGSYDRTIRRPNGLLLGIKRVPLGLIGVIYESRPNVTADSAALCIKSGNAVLLRGGKEAVGTNQAIANALRNGMSQSGLPADAISFIHDTSRESAHEMMGLTGILDVLIPRGGAGLIRSVTENARVPVIETGAGNCHIYVDGEADLNMALDIVVNAKCQRPSVCNACETVLVSREIAAEFLPQMKERLDAYSVALRCCPESAAILGGEVPLAQPSDWEKEYNDFILAVRVVGGLYQATAHIQRYGTRHSEAIVTKNLFTANRFTDRVDAACVYVNASTRFTDGEMFGLGGEIGISTQKLHVRGPIGPEHLTSMQYVIRGEGQVR